MNPPAALAVELSAEPRERAHSTHRIPSFFWSVRREIWQSPSLYVAPLLAGVVLLSSFVIRAVRSPEYLQRLGLHDFRTQNLAAAMLALSAFLAGVFYCIDALSGERRDRSILFWKSLPVSDLTTVLAKAFVPLVFLPAVVFLIGVCVQLGMVVVSLMISGAAGANVNAEVQWLTPTLLRIPLDLSWELLVLTVLLAPLYGWLLLVSAWARRAPALWAVLPPIGICVVEKMTFNTSYAETILGSRIVGGFQEAFGLFSPVPGQPAALPVLGLVGPRGPVSLLTGVDVWIGLTLTAAFLVAAARLRRHLEPI